MRIKNTWFNKIEKVYQNIKKNKYVDALKKVMLFSAAFHIIMIFIYSIVKLNTAKFNFFDILDLDLFFPKMIHGNISQITSAVTFVMLYALFVLAITFRRKLARKRELIVARVK